MSRRHPKRKNSNGRFAMIPLVVMQHVAVTSLSHAAFRVLLLLCAAYNGRNNGALGVTAGQAAESGIGSRNTLYRALHEIAARGLIVQTYPASRVPPRPAMWALTWLSVDDTEYSSKTRIPSHAYRSWKAAA